MTQSELLLKTRDRSCCLVIGSLFLALKSGTSLALDFDFSLIQQVLDRLWMAGGLGSRSFLSLLLPPLTLYFFFFFVSSSLFIRMRLILSRTASNLQSSTSTSGRRCLSISALALNSQQTPSSSSSSTPESKPESLYQKLKSNSKSTPIQNHNQNQSRSHRRSDSSFSSSNRNNSQQRNNNNNRKSNQRDPTRTTFKSNRSNPTSISSIPSIPLPQSLQPKTPWSSILHSISTPNFSSLPLISSPKYPSDQLSLNSKDGLPFPDLPRKPLRNGERSLRINPLSGGGVGLLGAISKQNEFKGNNLNVQRIVGVETLEKDTKGEGENLFGLERKAREMKFDEEIGGEYKRFQSGYLEKLSSEGGNGEVKKSVGKALDRNVDLSPEAKLWLMNAVQSRIKGKSA